jgi:hypothetical protein
VGGCVCGAGDGRGGSRELPAPGIVLMHVGPASALAPFPVPGRSSLFAFLRVACHSGGSREAVCGSHPEDAHTMCRRIVGVLKLMPVAGCVRVSGSVGRL